MQPGRVTGEGGSEARRPAAKGGPGTLSGIWHSSYTYESTTMGQVTRRHYVLLDHEGDRIRGESLAGSNDSPVSFDLTRDGPALTGTWTERTAAGGHYRGAVYHGALQLLVDPTSRRMHGMWVGFGKSFTIESGPWSLTFETADTTDDAVARFDRPPPDAAHAPNPPSPT